MTATTVSKMDRITPTLICPNSKLPLQQKKDSLNSNDGQHIYPLIDNIPVFEGLDEFYENRWSETDRSTGNLRNLLVKKQRFFVNHLKGQRGTVLDLGCGGGWKLFTTVGPVTGVDLSHGSLKIAQGIYDQVVQANWTKLPFADDSFDIVVSSDVLGHVAPEDKEKVWHEIVRILKPGGLTLHYIEANSDDPLMQWCKKYPELYQKYVIDTEGHIGMESAQDTILRFRHYNLEPVSEQGVYRLFMYLNRVPLLLDNEYRHKSPVTGLLVKLSQILLKNKLTEIVINLILVALIEIADRVLPEDWSNGVLVAYRKPKST
jgi:ubiquinone/menaquinone biosynthesis C-methylase UbiE